MKRTQASKVRSLFSATVIFGFGTFFGFYLGLFADFGSFKQSSAEGGSSGGQRNLPVSLNQWVSTDFAAGCNETAIRESSVHACEGKLNHLRKEYELQLQVLRAKVGASSKSGSKNAAIVVQTPNEVLRTYKKNVSLIPFLCALPF